MLADFFYDCEVALAGLMNYDNPLWEPEYWQKVEAKIFEDQGKFLKKIFGLKNQNGKKEEKFTRR